jgi:L-fucose isomerase-like protein
MNPEELHPTPPRPRLGILFLGRKRAGFDPEWGAEIRKRIRAFVETAGLEAVIPYDNIADDPALRDAIAQCRAQRVDALVVTQPTISDGRLAPVAAQIWDAPLVLWATPEKPTGEMISANSLVGTHVFAATMRQLHRPFEVVYGHPDEEQTREALVRAARITATAERVQRGKVGLIGYHAPGFIDLHADPLQLSESLGLQLHHKSVQEFLGSLDDIDDGDVEEERKRLAGFGLPHRGGVDESMLPMQARYYLGFSRVMEQEGLDGLAFRCWPDLPSITGHWPYFALATLVSEGKAVAMEGDVDGAICSIIAEGLGLGPVYLTDWLEHDERTITTWHTGAAPFQLSEPVGTEQGPHLSVQFNNKKPTVVEATIRADMAATLFRLWRCDGEYHMTAVEGQTRAPERHLLATNGRTDVHGVNVREWFDDMVHEGMPHHLCVIKGHHADTLRRVARNLGVRWHRA